MKKYLLPENVNWYRANLHSHSVISDGELTPEEMKAAYKAHGYSILAITDHEVIVDHSALSDGEFLMLTGSEYAIDEEFPSFPEINGEPKENWTRLKTIHLCLYAKDPHNTFHAACDESRMHWIRSPYREAVRYDGYHREYTRESINETIRRLNEAGYLVQYNHPNWSLNEYEDYTNLEGVWSLEILNYATELETGAEYCPTVYDEMLRRGMRNLYCSMGDDNHNHGGEMESSFGGSTLIGAKDLTYESVIAAMEKGDFYCTSGRDDPPRIRALYVEDSVIRVNCSPASAIFLTGYGRAFRCVRGEKLTHAEFPLLESDVYFRITVRDDRGNNAHTHAYSVADCQE